MYIFLVIISVLIYLSRSVSQVGLHAPETATPAPVGSPLFPKSSSRLPYGRLPKILKRNGDLLSFATFSN